MLFVGEEDGSNSHEEDGVREWRRLGQNEKCTNPNSHEEEILRGADVDVNTFTFNSVIVFCLQRINVIHLIQLGDENEPFKN